MLVVAATWFTTVEMLYCLVYYSVTGFSVILVVL